MQIGSARVSKYDQNLDLQIDALKQAGCEKIFSDKSSGGKMERQGLSEGFSHLREGDSFVVWNQPGPLITCRCTTSSCLKFIELRLFGRFPRE
ncbi:MAG: recombinase family protein [Desulfobacteraceae bacterium]|nr:recombinase family protein [Desulfobacteraceae bacterium]